MHAARARGRARLVSPANQREDDMAEVRTTVVPVSWPVNWSAIWLGTLAALGAGALFGLLGTAKDGAGRDGAQASPSTQKIWSVLPRMMTSVI